jgi:hypothetical protein
MSSWLRSSLRRLTKQFFETPSIKDEPSPSGRRWVGLESFLLLAFCVLAFGSAAFAAPAAISSTGELERTGPIQGAVPGKGVTASACGYANVNNATQVANSVMLGQEKPNGQNTISTVAPQDCKFTVDKKEYVGKGDKDRTKLPAGLQTQAIIATQTSKSNTDSATGQGSWVANAGGSMMQAMAQVTKGKGTAAGWASDPYTVAPGSYPYAPTIDSLQLQDEPGGVAEVEFDAMSSLATKGVLWDLLVKIDPADELSVTFKSFSPLSLGLSDDSIAALFGLALDTSVPWQASLTSPFTLFSTTLTATVSFTYADDVGALAAIPEPSTIALLLLGGGLLTAISLVRRSGQACPA